MQDIPSVTAKNATILYTENGILMIRVTAPVTEHFQFAPEPYTVFPEGITVHTYRDSMVLESTLTAKFATYWESKQLWMARYDVVASNAKGEVLNTEELYWDQGKKLIYGNDRVKITTADGVIFGDGFESDESFNEWVVKKPIGTLYVD